MLSIFKKRESKSVLSELSKAEKKIQKLVESKDGSIDLEAFDDE